MNSKIYFVALMISLNLCASVSNNDRYAVTIEQRLQDIDARVTVNSNGVISINSNSDKHISIHKNFGGMFTVRFSNGAEYSASLTLLENLSRQSPESNRSNS